MTPDAEEILPLVECLVRAATRKGYTLSGVMMRTNVGTSNPPEVVVIGNVKATGDELVALWHQYADFLERAFAAENLDIERLKIAPNLQ